MQVRFWGVRGSCPAPIGSDDVRERLLETLRLLGCRRPDLDLTDSRAVSQWLDTLPPRVTGVVGSNTPCVEMRTGHDDLCILDMGSGLRALGNHLMQTEFGHGRGRAAIFLSHFHWDHIQGWPFFKPAYVVGNALDIYTRHEDLKERLKSQQTAPFFPSASWEEMRATISFTHIDDSTFSCA